LQAVAVKKFPGIEALIKKLLNAGAEAAAMSGSGPTVFGVFASEQAAKKAAKKLKKEAKFCGAFKALV
jgi:4-diphosphocytidyl-2-C-methyl-D-erythritol kinase